MESDQAIRCLRCGGTIARESAYCSNCGLELNSPDAAELMDLEATERQIRRLSKFGLLENTLTRRFQSVIEDRRRMLGVKASSSPKTAIETTLPAAAREEPPIILDSSPIVAPRLPEPLALDPAAPVPTSQAAPLQSTPASTPAQIPSALPEAPKDKTRSSPISLGFSYDKPIAKSPVEHTAPKASTPPVLPKSAPKTVKPPPPPKPPGKPLSEILATFMEKRNIRWGEVVGGLLIVGCSIALVISLWDRLERIPYFQFLIFVSVTAALFGIGFYTLKRWKLESTSRGILTIATLLVPLNFLAIAGLSKGTGGFLDSLIELASIGIFTSLVSIAGRVLVPGAQWLLTMGLVGSSASQLLIVRFVNPGCTEWWYFGLGLLPVALYCLSAGGDLFKGANYRSFGRKEASALFSFIGMSTFALAVTLGFLFYRYGDVAKGLQSGAVLIALCGIPIATAGILVQRRLARDAAVATFRAFATGVALLGMLVMLYAVNLAWPQPYRMVLVCCVNFVALTAVALALRLAIAHIPALASLIVGYLTGYHWIFGHLSHRTDKLDMSLAGRIVSAESATALTGLFAILMLAAFFIYGATRKTERTIYLAASEVVALGSLILALVQGFAVPVHPAFVCGIYGLVALFLNLRWRQPAATYCGLALLCVSSVWILEWLSPQRLPLWASVLAAEPLLLGLALAALQRLRSSGGDANARTVFIDDEIYRAPIARVAERVAPLALLIGCLAWAASASPRWVFEHLLTGACLFAFYLLLTAIEKRPIQALLSGLMLIATVIAGVGWIGTRFRVADLQSWMAFAIAIAGMALALFAIRLPRTHSGKEIPDSKDSATARLDKPDLQEILASAWRHAAAAATALSFLLSFSSPTLGVFGLHTATAAALGLTAFMLSWAYRSRPLAWIGSGLIFLSVAHALFIGFPGVSGPRLLLAAFLLHSTVTLIAGLLAGWFAGAADVAERLRRILAQPIAASSLTSSFLSLPIFILVLDRNRMIEISLYIFWLAFLWLLISCFKRWPILFALSQAGSCVALLFAITSWLDRQPWVIGHRDGLMDPRSLQAYGIGLALACLLWVTARIRLQSNPTAQALLNPDFYALDRIVLAVVVGGYTLLSLNGAIPSVLEELSIIRPVAMAQQAILAWRTQVGGLGGWVLLGILTIALTLGLRQQWRRGRVFGILLLSLTAPMLIAARFNADLAVGAAVRWGVAAWFLGWSAALWLRGPLIRLAGAMNFAVDRRALPAFVIRDLVTLVSASWVLMITLAATMFGFGAVARPAAGSLFWHIGPLLGYVVPLSILGLVMLGHALRDGSQGFAFLAGQTMNFAITLAYALHVIEKGGALNWIFVAQVATIAAGVWAVVWTLSGAWKLLQRLAPQPPSERLFLNYQFWLGVAGNVILLGSALSSIVVLHPESVAGIGDAGSPLGWLAWAMVAGAAALRIHAEKASITWNKAGSIALAFIGLIACSFEREFPGSAYHVLMLGWGSLALAIAAVANWFLRLHASRSSESAVANIEDSAARWVRITGVLAVLLSLKAAWHGDHLWAAAAITCASLAGAWVAILLWHKGWAFASGLGANAAVSLVAWHFHASLLLLLQANLIASATIALLWLAVRRQLSPKQNGNAAASIDYLSVQVVIGLLGNACLVISALAIMVWDPSPNHWPPFLQRIGSAWGWLALVLSVAAGVWYWGQSKPQLRSHLLCEFGLALGVLAAASASPWDNRNWLSYHTLEVAWIVAGCLVLLAGRIARIFHIAPRIEILPPRTMRLWVQAISFMTVALAVLGAWQDPAWQDPGRPWWSAGVTLAAGGLLSAVAIRFRLPGCVYASGLMVNVIGILIWIVLGTDTTTGFILTNTLCLALASLFWSVVETVLRHRREPIDLRGDSRPFAHAAAVCSLIMLAFQSCIFLMSGFSSPGVSLAGNLAWTALAATFAALAVTLWDPQARFTFQGMYAAGLIAAVTALHAARLFPRELCWTASLTLSFFVLFMSTLGWLVPRFSRLGQRLRVPDRQKGWPVEWFLLIQRLLASLPIGLSLWVTLTFDKTRDRFAGPLSIVLILAAAVFLTERMTGDKRLRCQGSVLFLWVLAIAETGWAWLGLSFPSLLLHRTAIVTVALGMTSAISFIAPAQDSTSGAGWLHAIRRQSRVMTALTLVSLALTLFEEALLYVPNAGAQMALPAIFAIAIVMAGLIAAGICCALFPERDPFTLPENKRALYVYFAEGVLVLLFVHLRLTAPGFFLVQGFLKYWTLIIMALAFLGAGLSQVLDRKGVKVLAEPLLHTGVFLPILPVLGFWVHSTGNYSVLWFLVGLFYSFLSLTKRSYRFGLLAAISANNALWFLLHQTGIGFLQHPQMWLAPIAMTALITEYLNHDRLTQVQSAAVRYMALTVIYISSTADMFIAGLGNSLFLPLVLLLFSVLGVLLGILLQIRAYLFLGVSFLFLVIISMIWHAAVNLEQTWIWYASGIVLGAAILSLFALFEKRREDLLYVIDGLKKWD
jgi:hypothetical protein